MARISINNYIEKYGREFVLDACEQAEDKLQNTRGISAKSIKNRQNIARIQKKAIEMGVKLYG